jgi:hypothetical protein
MIDLNVIYTNIIASFIKHGRMVINGCKTVCYLTKLSLASELLP